MEYFTGALKRYADFNGRARRKEYWMYFLIYSIIVIALTVIDEVFGTVWLSLIATVALLIPSISITTRRLHDTGRSGWWQLINLIPLIGLIVMFVFVCQDSHEENDYGISPKFAQN